MNWIKRFFIKKALKPSGPSELEVIADDILKNSIKEMQSTGRTADKILKAKILRQESDHVLNKIQELDDEYSDDEDPAPSMEDNITNALISQLLKPKAAPAEALGPNVNYDDFGNPVPAQPAAPAVSDAAKPKTSLASIAEKLSPEDIEALKKQFLK